MLSRQQFYLSIKSHISVPLRMYLKLKDILIEKKNSQNTMEVMYKSNWMLNMSMGQTS